MLNTFVIIVLYCRMKRPPNQPLLSTVLFRHKLSPQSSTDAASDTSPVSENDIELAASPSTTNTEPSQENATCSTCNKPVSV